MNLYVISHCDIWHSRSSLKLIGVVNEDELHNAMVKIKKELDYTDEDLDNYIDVQTVELNDLDI